MTARQLRVEQLRESDFLGSVTESWTVLDNVLYLACAIGLIALNGFFVAAEFALVKLRIARIDQLVRDKRMFASTARWLAVRLDKSLSACQLGITMASLALGWVGEPAFARLVDPILVSVGIRDERILHVLSFIAAFSAITGLHLVVGEQFPKIFAIRRPETMLLWCALPLRICYAVLYPFLVVLDAVTSFLLRLAGISGQASHDAVNSEEEIRALLREAHIHGNLTRNEHSLINNVFEFDDLIVRRVMLPRGEIAFIDIHESLPNLLKLVRQTKHTRYPVCDRSLDRVLGVIHIKDLVGLDPDSTDFDPTDIMRPPKKVPESMPISLVLRHFQATHQLMAFVVDEYGTTTGLVTLENVLERIVGDVDDEFDVAKPNVVPCGPGEFMVSGTTLIAEARSKMNLSLDQSEDADTISGLLTELTHGFLATGDEIVLDGAIAQVMEVKHDRAIKVRFRIIQGASEEPHSETESEHRGDGPID